MFGRRHKPVLVADAPWDGTERRRHPRVCFECGAGTGHYLCDDCLAERMGRLADGLSRALGVS